MNKKWKIIVPREQAEAFGVSTYSDTGLLKLDYSKCPRNKTADEYIYWLKDQQIIEQISL